MTPAVASLTSALADRDLREFDRIVAKAAQRVAAFSA